MAEKLNDLGYSCGIADGYFGLKTKNALIKFQLENGLTTDGVLGNKTLDVLNRDKVSVKVESAPDKTYTVVKGDTLGKIAKKFLGASNKYPEIMKANGLKNVTIHPGDVLTIPSRD